MKYRTKVESWSGGHQETYEDISHIAGSNNWDAVTPRADLLEIDAKNSLEAIKYVQQFLAEKGLKTARDGMIVVCEDRQRYKVELIR